MSDSHVYASSGLVDLPTVSDPSTGELVESDHLHPANTNPDDHHDEKEENQLTYNTNKEHADTNDAIDDNEHHQQQLQQQEQVDGMMLPLAPSRELDEAAHSESNRTSSSSSTRSIHETHIDGAAAEHTVSQSAGVTVEPASAEEDNHHRDTDAEAEANNDGVDENHPSNQHQPMHDETIHSSTDLSNDSGPPTDTGGEDGPSSYVVDGNVENGNIVDDDALDSDSDSSNDFASSTPGHPRGPFSPSSPPSNMLVKSIMKPTILPIVMKHVTPSRVKKGKPIVYVSPPPTKSKKKKNTTKKKVGFNVTVETPEQQQEQPQQYDQQQPHDPQESVSQHCPLISGSVDVDPSVSSTDPHPQQSNDDDNTTHLQEQQESQPYDTNVQQGEYESHLLQQQDTSPTTPATAANTNHESTVLEDESAYQPHHEPAIEESHHATHNHVDDGDDDRMHIRQLEFESDGDVEVDYAGDDTHPLDDPSTAPHSSSSSSRAPSVRDAVVSDTTIVVVDETPLDVVDPTFSSSSSHTNVKEEGDRTNRDPTHEEEEHTDTAMVPSSSNDDHVSNGEPPFPPPDTVIAGSSSVVPVDPVDVAAPPPPPPRVLTLQEEAALFAAATLEAARIAAVAASESTIRTHERDQHETPPQQAKSSSVVRTSLPASRVLPSLKSSSSNSSATRPHRPASGPGLRVSSSFSPSRSQSSAGSAAASTKRIGSRTSTMTRGSLGPIVKVPSTTQMRVKQQQQQQPQQQQHARPISSPHSSHAASSSGIDASSTISHASNNSSNISSSRNSSREQSHISNRSTQSSSQQHTYNETVVMNGTHEDDDDDEGHHHNETMNENVVVSHHDDDDDNSLPIEPSNDPTTSIPPTQFEQYGIDTPPPAMTLPTIDSTNDDTFGPSSSQQHSRRSTSEPSNVNNTVKNGMTNSGRHTATSFAPSTSDRSSSSRVDRSIPSSSSSSSSLLPIFTPLSQRYSNATFLGGPWEPDDSHDIMSVDEARHLFRLIDGLLPIVHRTSSSSNSNSNETRRPGHHQPFQRIQSNLFEQLERATLEAHKIATKKTQQHDRREEEGAHHEEHQEDGFEQHECGERMEEKEEMHDPNDDDLPSSPSSLPPRLLSPSPVRYRLPPLGRSATQLRRSLLSSQLDGPSRHTRLTVIPTNTPFQKLYANMGGASRRGFGTSTKRP